jgi:chorismate mutase / prephenate dehydratase
MYSRRLRRPDHQTIRFLRMEKPVTDISLEQIRKEIDHIDQAMLELLDRRFAAIEAIKAIKKHDIAKASSPLRPAREAKILRRLIGLRRGPAPAQLMVRLWRSIISTATHAQANITVHISVETAADHRLRDLIRDHFAPLAVRAQGDVRDVVGKVEANALDIGVVEAAAQWVEPLLKGDTVKVMGVLPVIGRREQRPDLLILGRATVEPSGDDETLLAIRSTQRLPEKFLWEAKAGDYRCVSVRGFVREQSPEFLRFKELDAKILGQCPCPLEAGP